MKRRPTKRAPTGTKQGHVKLPKDVGENNAGLTRKARSGPGKTGKAELQLRLLENCNPYADTPAAILWKVELTTSLVWTLGVPSMNLDIVFNTSG